jgi:hypothetical protein
MERTPPIQEIIRPVVFSRSERLSARIFSRYVLIRCIA